jgi:hypothetical protein
LKVNWWKNMSNNKRLTDDELPENE